MGKNSRVILNIFWFAVIAFLSYRMPLYVDDYLHKTSFATGEEIRDITLILPSVMVYYNTWGGRAVSMFLIQLMLFLPRWVYAVSNGLIFVFMVNTELGYTYIREFESSENQDDKKSFLQAAFLFLMTWFFMADFSGVMTWITGAITYLWMNTAILAFGLLYYRDYIRRIRNVKCDDGVSDATGMRKVMSIIGHILLGFVAGLSTEAGSCALMLALFLYTAQALKSHVRPSVEKVLGLISAFAGFLMLMLAPGNYVRVADARQQAEQGASFIRIIFHRIGRETFYALLFLTIPVAIAIVLYILSGRREEKSSGSVIKGIIADISEGGPLFFIMVGGVSILVFTFTSGFAGRVFQFPLMMLSISAGISLRLCLTHLEDVKDSGRILNAFRVFAVIMMLFVCVEIAAGSLYAAQSGSYFDRQMLYYHYDDKDVDGLLPGNGIRQVLNGE